MTAKQKLKVTKGNKVEKFNSDLYASSGLVLGFVSIALSLMSLLGYSTTVSILALVIGALAVWLTVRQGHYHVLFGGLSGLLLAVVGILNMTNGFN